MWQGDRAVVRSPCNLSDTACGARQKYLAFSPHNPNSIVQIVVCGSMGSSFDASCPGILPGLMDATFRLRLHVGEKLLDVSRQTRLLSILFRAIHGTMTGSMALDLGTMMG